MIETNFKFTKKDKVIILTGAGISAESGLKTFRDNNGLWENHRVEEVATPQAFARNPEMVWKFYKQRYSQLEEVAPNPGHFALKELEDFCDNNFMLITQNIDGLHSTAGNKRVLEMHGSLHDCYCSKCNAAFKMKDINLNVMVPKCSDCGGDLRPDIVWFGEIPYYLNEIDLLLKNVNYFIVVGTSGVVQPAASFLYLARMNGARTIGVNMEAPENMMFIDEFHQGASGEILPKLVKLWIN
ncbi:MAG: NAD-dependent protein deacylase [Candidatus Cloacimonadota bacterium]|nr:MAG: NAD-dependent protein deacylase [Candidatus Cloacimonadota bacterium]HHE64922.1 NAD-dependent deacylase [Bacteroidota bacterium]